MVHICFKNISRQDPFLTLFAQLPPEETMAFVPSGWYTLFPRDDGCVMCVQDEDPRVRFVWKGPMPSVEQGTDAFHELMRILLVNGRVSNIQPRNIGVVS